MIIFAWNVLKATAMSMVSCALDAIENKQMLLW